MIASNRSSTAAADDDRPALLDVKQVAELLTVSPRHVARLRDGGLMPQPVKLGTSVRWRRVDLESWIAAGCPAVRTRSR